MHRSRRGFSLVEVTIAMGIVSFALISLIGLLSVGIFTGKESTEDTRLAAVSKYVMTESQRMPFNNLGNTSYYFDFDGNTLSNSNGAYFRCTVSTRALGNVLTNVSTNLIGVTASFVSPRGKTNALYFQRANE
jgi:uncharacterized protein (TIGR02598 family)